MSLTRISRHIKAPRATVYRALLDASAVAKWKVPDGITCKAHEFDARENGFSGYRSGMTRRLNTAEPRRALTRITVAL